MKNGITERWSRLGSLARALLLPLLAAATILPSSAAMALMPHPDAPRLVNYYLRTDIVGKESVLAQWDMLILPYQLWDLAPSSIALIKALNPDQLTLAYIDPVLIPDNPVGGPGGLQYDFVSGVYPLWMAFDIYGLPVSFWEHAIHVNITEVCPTYFGMKYRDYFVEFLSSRFVPLIEVGMMDGIFLDEMSNGGYIWWEPSCGCQLDYDNDHVADSDQAIEAWLTASMRMFADELSAALPDGAVLIGNNCKPRHGSLNGKFYESFPASWEGTLAGSLIDLDVWSSLAEGLTVPCVNGVVADDDLHDFRYRYAASLLQDTYFSFDHSTGDHHQLTWYDLFDVELGRPQGPRHILGETPLVENVFEDPWNGGFYDGIHSAYMAELSLTDEPALVIQGSQSLLIDVFDYIQDPWPSLAEILSPEGFEPDTSYTVSFRYRVIETEQEESQLFLKALTETGGSDLYVESYKSKIYTGAEGLFRSRVDLLEPEDYRLYLKTQGHTTLAIDSLTVVKGAGGLWARNYEYGLVVVNPTDTTTTRTLPYNAEWSLVDADSQRIHYPGWGAGQDIELRSYDGLVFRYEGTGVTPSVPPAPRLSLSAPWPNPGNPVFHLTLSASEGTAATLTLHDVSGRRVAELWQGRLSADERILRFNADAPPLNGLSSGLYLLRLTSGDQVAVRKWALLR